MTPHRPQWVSFAARKHALARLDRLRLGRRRSFWNFWRQTLRWPDFDPVALEYTLRGRERRRTMNEWSHKDTRSKRSTKKHMAHLQIIHELVVELVEGEHIVQGVHQAVIRPSLQVLHDRDELAGGVRVGE